MLSRRRYYRILAALVLIVLASALALRRLLLGLPDVLSLETYTPALTSRVYDVKGNVVAEFAIERRTWLPLSQIPVDLQNAVISVEDDQFYNHWGISLKGIVRSALIDIFARRVVQGASTITQQLAKQIFLSRRRTMARKIREVLMALQIERNYSKNEILQFYLNQVYFGQGAYGVKSAARIFFEKEPSDLTLPECALLAGLIRAPIGYSPFAHPDQALKRRSVVLKRMLDRGVISQKEFEAAQNTLIPTIKPMGLSTQAPYFVEYIRRIVEAKYGTNALWRGGLKIYTTLDLGMQKTAETVMEKRLAEFDARALDDWNKKQARLKAQSVAVSTQPPSAVQGAFVLLDVKTGAIRAMIGGRQGSIFNRAVQARRQPGSTFKPFVWGAALNSGMTAASLVDDSPLAFYYDGRDWRLLPGATDQYTLNVATQSLAASQTNNPDFEVWMPNDFDNKYLGLTSLERALAESRNIASIRLIEKLGPPVVVSFAHQAGIVSHLDPVLSLGLGSAVVSPLEMASAFGTFANGGIHETAYPILRVEDNSGKILENHLPEEREAVTPQLSYLITSLLKGVIANGTGTYARRLKRPVAGKTGTTNENRDLWFIGYTPDLVAAAWMGYDDFTSLGPKDRTGGQTVLPWWTEIMGQVLNDFPKRDFVIPSKIVLRKIDDLTGFLALPTCPPRDIMLEAFLAGTEPKALCPVSHAKPLQPQMEALTSSGTVSVVAAPASAMPVIVAPVSASTAPPEEIPPPAEGVEESVPAMDDQNQEPPEAPVFLQ